MVSASVVLVVVVLGIGFAGALPKVMLSLARRNSTDERQEHAAPITSVTFLVATYNEERFIEEKILDCARLISNGPDALECDIVVVDGGSSDDTVGVVEHLAIQQPDLRVRLVRAPRPGKASLLNFVRNTIHSDLVVVTDADTLVSPDYVMREVLHLFAADSSLAVVSGCTSPAQSLGSTWEELYWEHEVFDRLAESAAGSAMFGYGAFFALRRDVWVPIPENCRADDIFLSLEAHRRRMRIKFLPTLRVIDRRCGIDWRTVLKHKIYKAGELYRELFRGLRHPLQLLTGMPLYLQGKLLQLLLLPPLLFILPFAALVCLSDHILLFTAIMMVLTLSVVLFLGPVLRQTSPKKNSLALLVQGGELCLLLYIALVAAPIWAALTAHKIAHPRISTSKVRKKL